MSFPAFDDGWAASAQSSSGDIIRDAVKKEQLIKYVLCFPPGGPAYRWVGTSLLLKRIYEVHLEDPNPSLLFVYLVEQLLPYCSFAGTGQVR